jgi:glycosyltransferase involved in cell wall biosynthesis
MIWLFVDNERVWRGGQEQLFTLIKGLHQRGHSVHLICEPGTLMESRADGIGIVVYPTKIRYEAGLISLLHLISILRKVRPDVLAFNTPKAILAGILASQLVPVGARIVFRRVDFPLRTGFFTRIKYMWGIDCVVVISESIQRRLRDYGIPDSKIKTIYEGVDLALYAERNDTKQRLPDAPAVVGTVAHLSREKGLNYLIEAAELIPDVQRKLRFVIVGEGVCLRELQEQAATKGLKDVFQFTGFRSDIPQCMKTFDMFVLPSISEGLATAILEAMASSLAIVATAVGGIPELVINGENGLLVAPADPASLARAIQHLADNPGVCQRMGVLGRKRIEDRFTLERKILETEQLCGVLLQRSARSSRSAYA